jgi:hypothetical protein
MNRNGTEKAFERRTIMCGCMMMDAAMDHQGHMVSNQPALAPKPNSMSDSSGWHCAHCGFPINQGFAYCPNCGMSLKMTKCPACGQKVDPAWSACAYCGSPRGEMEKQPALA